MDHPTIPQLPTGATNIPPSAKRRDSSDPAPHKSLSTILFLIALTPVAYMAWMLAATAVNILILDEWDYIFLFRHVASHTLTLHDLLQQHNESRTTLPNLIVLGLGLLNHWDTRWDMWVSFLFACVTSASVYLLSRRTLNRRQALILWTIANILIFSTEQSQNWLWGIQMIVFMPITFTALGLLTAYSRMNVTLKFALCMALATASTFSYANGQLAWVLLLIALIIGSWDQTRRFGWRISMWVIIWAANMWVYYRDYRRPLQNPSMFLILQHPIQAAEYFAAFLGASLAEEYHSLRVSVAFGMLLLACLAIACWYLWRRRGCERLLPTASVWLLVSAYAVVSALVTTTGRLGFGVTQSQDSRYTTVSIYLVVALLYLGAIIVKDVYRQGNIISACVRTALGLALVLMPQVVAQVAGYREMWAHHRGCLASRACIQTIDITLQPNGLTYPAPQKVVAEVGFLNQMGYLSPGLLKDRDLSTIDDKIKGKSFGYVETLTPLPDNQWFAQGWAVNPMQAAPANLVILAAEDSQGRPQAFATALVTYWRPDVAKAERHDVYFPSGWRITFKSSDLPPGTRAISAWAYDSLTGLAHRLESANEVGPLRSSKLVLP